MQKIILLAAGTIGAAVAGYFLKPKVTSFFGGTDSPMPSSVRRSRGRQRRGFSVPQDLTPENLNHAFQMTLRE